MLKLLSLCCAILLLSGSAASALPGLQLGPGTFGGWSFDPVDETWIAVDDPFQLLATANAVSGNGAYPWDQTSTRYAYLVVAAVPQTNDGADLFDITVSNDGGNLALVASGDGTPPFSDPLPPHGVYSTYFEIYEFTFDGPVTTIENTQPPGGDPGDGYVELFDIAVNSLANGLLGLHFDLFTIEGAGQLNGESEVYAKAPFSHDAAYAPEPGAVSVFSVGLLVAGALIRKLRRP